jgi:hypothetical protein
VPVHLHGPASVCLLVLRRVVCEARHPDVWSVSNYPASVLALSLAQFCNFICRQKNSARIPLDLVNLRPLQAALRSFLCARVRVLGKSSLNLT